jgi:hypothetical protein
MTSCILPWGHISTPGVRGQTSLVPPMAEIRWSKQGVQMTMTNMQHNCRLLTHLLDCPTKRHSHPTSQALIAKSQHHGLGAEGLSPDQLDGTPVDTCSRTLREVSSQSLTTRGQRGTSHLGPNTLSYDLGLSWACQHLLRTSVLRNGRDCRQGVGRSLLTGMYMYANYASITINMS